MAMCWAMWLNAQLAGRCSPLQWAHRSVCKHWIHWMWTHTRPPRPAGSDPRAHRQPQTPAHTFNQDTFAVPLHQMSYPHLRLFPAQLNKVVLGRSVNTSGNIEHLWKHWTSLERVLWAAGNTSPLPAQEILPQGSSMMRDACNYGYVSFQFYSVKAQQALNYWACVMTCALCSTVYINNATVCAKDWPCSQPGSRSIDYLLWSCPNCMNTETE